MKRAVLFIALLWTSVLSVHAQSYGVKTIEAPGDPTAIALDTGGVDGPGARESWYVFGGETRVRNVRHATLTPILPDKDTATGAAVIVAPGGAFVSLSMQGEGWTVAQWLADHGIAAFVLKYRLRSMPEDWKEFFAETGRILNASNLDHAKSLETPADAIADAEAALRLVRTRADEWGVDATRIGMMGFSAGAMITLSLTSKASETMPAFIAPIYGPMNAMTVPVNAPPMFVVFAADDPLFAKRGFGLIDSWIAAKKPVELHLYQKGGHGFGMGKAETTTANWLESLHRWLAMNGILRKGS